MATPDIYPITLSRILGVHVEVSYVDTSGSRALVQEMMVWVTNITERIR